MQIEVTRQEAEFLEDDLRALQPLGVFVLIHFFIDIFRNLLAAGQLAFYLLLDRITGVLAEPVQGFIDGSEELLSFRRSDFLFCGTGRGLNLNADIALC